MAGSGESAGALLSILEIQEPEKKTSLKALETLAAENADDLAFAEAIIKLHELK